MSRYAFYRIYRRQERIGDDAPVVSAVVGWALYIGVVVVPLLAIVLALPISWLPDLLVAHPVVTAMLVAVGLMLFAYLRWVRTAQISKLGEIYSAQPRYLKWIREVMFWLWLLLGPILFVSSRWFPH